MDWTRARAPICRAAAALATPRLLHAPAPTSLLHVLTDYFTEARKQARAETEYNLSSKQEEYYDSSLLVAPLDITNSALRSGNRTTRSPSPIKDLDTLIARVVVKRRGSEDSIRTAYRVDEKVPDSAYRGRSDLESDRPTRQ